jgi:hypothetical protein
VAVAVDPVHAVEVQADVGAVGGDDAVFFFAGEKIDEALLGFADALPGGDGVGAVEEAGGEDEVFIFVEAHLGVLGCALAGKLGADPVKGAFGGALHEGVHEGLAGGLGDADFFRVAVGKGLGVFLCPDADGGVEGLIFVEVEWGAVAELLVGGVFEKDLVEFFGDHADHGVAAGGQDLGVKFDDERLGHGWATDAHELALLDTDAVVDQYVRKLGKSGVSHL